MIKRKIRVLHLHTLPVVSGSGLNTFYTMKYTNMSKFDVSLACHHCFEGNTSSQANLIYLCETHNIHVIKMKHLVQPMNPIKDMFAVLETIWILKKYKFDIIHTHNSKAGFIGRLAGYLIDLPVVVHTIHGFSFHDSESFLKRNLFKYLEIHAAPWADCTISISQAMSDWAVKEDILTTADITKIHSGIELMAFKPSAKKREIARNQFNIKDDLVLGCISKLWWGKGHEHVISAMPEIVQKVPNLKLMIIGEGPLQERLEAQVDKLHLKKHVIFTGFQENISDIAQALDIKILASEFEGMARVLLEAMALGIPVIANNVGGMRDLVINDYNGYLIDASRPSEIVKTVIAMVSNPNKLSVLGKNAFMFAHQPKFDAQTMAEHVSKVYLDCAKKKGIFCNFELIDKV